MRVGPSRLSLIDVARQSGQEAVLPHQRMFPRRRALPHKRAPVAALVLPGRAAAPFCFSNQSLLMLALWSCGRRASVVQAQRQIHRVLPAACTSRYRIRARAHLLTAALMPAEPHIRSPFSERLAPQSLILKVIGLGRVGPHCMAAYRSHCSRRSTRPDPRG